MLGIFLDLRNFTKMTNEQFLHSNQKKMFPYMKSADEIEIGRTHINKFGMSEGIFQAPKKFQNKTYFNTVEYVDGCEAGFKRFYEMIDNDPNKIIKLNQKTFDKQFRESLN